MKLTIDDVRSRFIKHLMEPQARYMLLPDVLT